MSLQASPVLMGHLCGRKDHTYPGGRLARGGREPELKIKASARLCSLGRSDEKRTGAESGLLKACEFSLGTCGVCATSATRP